VGLSLPPHRVTTAHASSLYPFVAGDAPGRDGVVLGVDALSGSPFVFDPFLAYRAGLVSNPNVLVIGEPGTGKSAFVKSLLHRCVTVLGRSVAVLDPKGEYGPLAGLLGLPVVALRPGGPQRLNPLDAEPGEDPGHRADRHLALSGALATTLLDRDLAPAEEAALAATVAIVGRRRGATLADVVGLLAAPTAELASAMGSGLPGSGLRGSGGTAGPVGAGAGAELGPLVLALGRVLAGGRLRSMFDGPTTVRPDRRGVVIDLSGVHHDPAALAVVLAATMTWLQGVLVSADGPRLQVLDEAWAVLSREPTVRFLQASWKLSRAYGVANVAVVHRCSDLHAQSDDATAAAKIASGLLADTATRVVFRQAPGEAALARRLLGLTGPETTLVTRLARGRALWRLGGRPAVVQHHLSRREAVLCDTDARMRG